MRNYGFKFKKYRVPHIYFDIFAIKNMASFHHIGAFIQEYLWNVFFKTRNATIVCNIYTAVDTLLVDGVLILNPFA